MRQLLNAATGAVAAPVAAAPAPAAPVAPAAPAEDAASSVDVAGLSQALVNLVSEKTGYPTEMLELDMDMEADLGIDSIKRVEILGALQEQYPELPRTGNAEEMGEIRTLAQIVEAIANQLAAQKKKVVTADPSSQPVTAADTTGVATTAPVPPAAVDGVERHQVELSCLPMPDRLSLHLPEGHIGLVTDDGTELTTTLVQTLTQQGWKIVVLSFPSSVIAQSAPLPADVPRVTLDALSEAELEQKLALITSTYGSVAGFIHLHPSFQLPTNQALTFIETEKDIVKQVFFMAKHLKSTLNQAAQNGHGCFYTVARLDGAFGLERSHNFGAIAAGLFGLTKSLGHEWQSVYCRALDLSPSLSAGQAADAIAVELQDPDRTIREVAYGSQGRVTLVC
jgi:acyl carrier protein